MRRANDVLGAQAPDVEVVDPLYVRALLETLLQGLGINHPRRLGHEVAHSCHGCSPGGHHHKEAKQDGAQRICVIPIADWLGLALDSVVSNVERLPPHQAGGHDDTSRLHNVTNDVHHRRVQREVLAFPALAVTLAVVIIPVGVSVTMGVSMVTAIVMGVAVAQDLHQDEVEEQAQASNSEHDLRMNLLGAEEASDGLNQENRR